MLLLFKSDWFNEYGADDLFDDFLIGFFPFFNLVWLLEELVALVEEDEKEL